VDQGGQVTEHDVRLLENERTMWREKYEALVDTFERIVGYLPDGEADDWEADDCWESCFGIKNIIEEEV